VLQFYDSSIIFRRFAALSLEGSILVRQSNLMRGGLAQVIQAQSAVSTDWHPSMPRAADLHLEVRSENTTMKSSTSKSSCPPLATSSHSTNIVAGSFEHKYRPLSSETREIRLRSIRRPKAGRADQGLSCSLIAMRADSAPHYIALFYT
jgi:hypothetical protein